MDQLENFKPAKYDYEMFDKGETKLIIPKEIKDYLDIVSRSFYKFKTNELKVITKFLEDYKVKLKKQRKEYEQLEEKEEDEKWGDYEAQCRYSIEYIDDVYKTINDWINW
jgi:hypothetical protein